MKEYPTLGGLKKLQEFLEKQGFPMPVFAMDIYRDKRRATSEIGEPTSGWTAGKGMVVSLIDEIKTHGPLHGVIDVQLTNQGGNKFVRFSNPAWWGGLVCARAIVDDDNVFVSSHRGDSDFNQFFGELCKTSGFSNLLKYGKVKPSLRDRISPKKCLAKMLQN